MENRKYLAAGNYYSDLAEALAATRATVASGYRYHGIYTQLRAPVATIDHKTGYFMLQNGASAEEQELIYQANRVEEALRSSTATGFKAFISLFSQPEETSLAIQPTEGPEIGITLL